MKITPSQTGAAKSSELEIFEIAGLPGRFCLSWGAELALQRKGMRTRQALIRLGALIALRHGANFSGTICEIMSGEIYDAVKLRLHLNRWAQIICCHASSGLVI